MEITETMIKTFWGSAAWPGPNDLDVRRGLAAVLRAQETDIEETHEPWCEGCNAPHQIKGDGRD